MILLTGASGFIGKHLLSSLVNSYGRDNIIALTSRPIEECRYVIHDGYSFDDNIFEVLGYADSIETIIHAGAFTPKNSSQANDWEKCNQNIYSIDKLLRSFLPRVKTMIYLSTLDIYADTDIISEESIINPSSLYGLSKFYGEKVINSWAESNNTLGHILRIGHVYGPGEEAYQKIIPVTIKKILHNEPVELWGDGNDLRSFIYIQDVVEAILNAINLREDIGPVNLVSKNAISIKDIVKQIIMISGKDSEIKFMPKNSGTRNLRFDNSKMRRHLLSDEIILEKGLRLEWDYMLNLK